MAVPPPSATCGRARRSGAGRAGGGLGRPPAPNAANPRRPGPGHKSAGSRRGRGRSWRERCPGCLGVGSPAGPQPSPPSPSASSGPPPRPRCCFGTRSRSTTTSTPPAATCGESRRERGFARRKKKTKKSSFWEVWASSCSCLPPTVTSPRTTCRELRPEPPAGSLRPGGFGWAPGGSLEKGSQGARFAQDGLSASSCWDQERKALNFTF